MIKPVMGIQLYTLRDHIKNPGDFDTTLARLSEMGVTDVQISGIGDFSAETQRDILNKHNIKVCVTHKPFERMTGDLDNLIAEHKIISCDALGVGSAPGKARENSRETKAFIETACEIGRKCKEQGMTFNYHNHSFEFFKFGDRNCCMMDMLIDEADPEYFNFIPDVAWIHYADRNPVDILKRMKGRVKVLHFKDYAVDNGGYRHFVSLGKGTVNLRECYEAACELEIPYIMYEQDCDWVNNDPFEATKESWEFMQEISR